MWLEARRRGGVFVALGLRLLASEGVVEDYLWKRLGRGMRIVSSHLPAVP